MTHDPDATWRDQAACRGLDPALFFPHRGEESREAKKVCSTCPVIDACLAEGMTERFGIWGGKSDRQRRKMRRAQRIELADPDLEHLYDDDQADEPPEPEQPAAPAPAAPPTMTVVPDPVRARRCRSCGYLTTRCTCPRPKRARSVA